MSVPEQLVAAARSVLGSVTQTDYQHTDHIIPAKGVFDCDCNGFMAYLLRTAAPDQYALVLADKEPTQSRPRAFVYYDFFAALTPESPGGWRRIDLLSDARPGDVIAWRFPTVEKHEDTGHVVLVADKPVLDDAGNYRVKVIDSAAGPHFDDPRTAKANGVGSGVVLFKVDGAGRPIAYLFGPPDTAPYEYRPIAIGRAAPL